MKRFKSEKNSHNPAVIIKKKAVCFVQNAQASSRPEKTVDLSDLPSIKTARPANKRKRKND
ncbi:hypothetical protein KKC34_03735 [bacterium]|nr:hypothetical protein [bacterium]MBU1502674.1 hypothetical protein [bacterium]